MIENGDERFVQGTGSFFRSNDKTYLITAAHVFQGIDPNNMGIPLGPYRTNCLSLGPGTIHCTTENDSTDVNIAVFPVNSAELIARMEWQCLTTKNIAALRPSGAMNEFLLFGYPDCRVKVTGVQVAVNQLLLRTSRYFGSVRIKKTHPLVDLFLAYGDNAIDSNGREVQAPPLGGISGTPVGAVERTNSGVWSPECSLHVVGVDSACVSRRGSKIYLIAKQWAAIWKVFERIDAEVAMEIHQALYL